MKGKTTMMELMDCPNRVLHSLYYKSYLQRKAMEEEEERRKKEAKNNEKKSKEESELTTRQMIENMKLGNLDIDDLEDLVD